MRLGREIEMTEIVPLERRGIRGAVTQSNNCLEVIDWECLFFLFANTRTRGQSMTLKGNKFNTDKGNALLYSR